MLELVFADIPSVGTTDNELQFDSCASKCVFKPFRVPESFQAQYMLSPIVLWKVLIFLKNYVRE